MHMAEAVKELLTLEEKRGGRDISSLIIYTLKYGTNHLLNPDHGYSFRTSCDLDIKGLFILMAIIVIKTLRSCLNSLCKPKQEPAPVEKAEQEVPLARKVY